MTAHYDSVQAGAGAADDGMAVAGILEMARILKDVITSYSIHYTKLYEALAPPDDNSAATGYFEALESMVVSLPGRALVVGPTHQGCEFHVLHPRETMTRVFQRNGETANDNIT